jgi:membrane protease YdiL (CAAX protease family)
MIVITLAIFIAYAALIALSLILDPKKRRAQPGAKRSIFRVLLFSTCKMLLAIAIVIVACLVSRINLLCTLGFSGLLLNWQGLGFGIVAAVGFVMIYLLWQVSVSRVFKKSQADENKSDLIDLLPKQWLPLVSVFLIISLEAGLLEEIFFRGIIQPHIDVHFAASWAVIASGVLFGIAHFYQGLAGVIGTSALGVWLGFMFAMTGNLLVPILGHFLGDFCCMMLGARKIMQHESNK